MKSKIFDILSFVFFIVLICFIHFGTLLSCMKVTDILMISKILHVFGIISIIIYICYKVINRKKINIYDVIIVLLTIFAIISTIYAYDQKVALIGANTRYEGLYSILSYYSFFLLATTLSKKYQKIIMYILVFFGTFQIILGIIQSLRIENILGYDRSHNFSAKFYSASGTFSNPNFYSTYILMCLLWLIGDFQRINKLLVKIFYSILIVIYIYGLFIGNTLSSILIFIFITAILITKNIKFKSIKKNIIPIIIVPAILLYGIFMIDKYTNHKLTRYIQIGYSIDTITNILKNGIQDSTGHYRIYVWKETIKKVPEYIITGIGPDNFAFINNGSPIIVTTKKDSMFFDKAHNDYLQILITQGIFAFICYMILIVLVFKTGFMNKNKETKGLFIAFVGYLLQMLIVFSFITVAPMFYMIMGFIVNKKELKE